MLLLHHSPGKVKHSITCPFPHLSEKVLMLEKKNYYFMKRQKDMKPEDESTGLVDVQYSTGEEWIKIS